MNDQEKNEQTEKTSLLQQIASRLTAYQIIFAVISSCLASGLTIYFNQTTQAQDIKDLKQGQQDIKQIFENRKAQVDGLFGKTATKEQVDFNRDEIKEIHTDVREIRKIVTENQAKTK